ncbi:tripartite tricarboxylate transporter TctB family protein [Devosia sp.]|uniref:tripartite tricarboxylate transporter TctB family protein n=1 Tax=Devosia sp. TaxID=1871048 RepID=UPI002733342E|nr:tripartite tricarboxylate transporter TctB family protein [Devosia sp.]MDP2779125.1 tripartite tricarboxylate transporter TctB family protein [Devosia sp.]
MDSVLGVIFALGGAAILQQALNLHPLPGMSVGPGLFPSIVGGAMGLLGVVLAVQGWLVPDDPEDEAPPLVTWFAAGIVASLIALIFATPVLGFLVAGTIFAFVVVMISKGGWLAALIFSPIATGAVYFLFTLVLRVSLPRGLLG